MGKYATSTKIQEEACKHLYQRIQALVGECVQCLGTYCIQCLFVVRQLVCFGIISLSAFQKVEAEGGTAVYKDCCILLQGNEIDDSELPFAGTNYTVHIVCPFCIGEWSYDAFNMYQHSIVKSSTGRFIIHTTSVKRQQHLLPSLSYVFVGGSH